MSQRQAPDQTGATFSEVMVAMALIAVAVVGTMGAFEAADKTLGRDVLAVRALSMVEARIEAKCAVPWDGLLLDDLNHDGIPETIMRDDGAGGDRIAGDGIYSAMLEAQGVKVVWTVAPRLPGPFSTAGAVMIEARGYYAAGGSEREVRLATLRANSAFAGTH
jgi:Flp pilus assembly pilin Flp